MAKLTRWGVDFHMGVLFGLANQWVLIAFGLALCVAILLGYRLWWLRRPQGALINPGETLSQGWLALPLTGRIVTLCIAMIFGATLPIMGASLIAFLLVDVIRWRQARQRTVQQNA